MAARTELFGVGQFHRRVEGAPEQDAADEAADRQKAQAEVHAGAADDVPVALYWTPAAWPRPAARGTAHRNSACVTLKGGAWVSSVFTRAWQARQRL
ncbi:hypothetical protein G6F65_021849 [Rhizopus arrhizus]|nr:hypothetical protein G6F65_021849 [Rhizopus arrhizus]